MTPNGLTPLGVIKGNIMDYLFHQITIFIMTTIYIPLTIFQVICIVKAINWKYYLLHTIAILCLINGLPITLMNYQQYIMGHPSGLSETITKSVTTADIIVLILIFFTATVVIIGNIMIKKNDRNIELLKNKIERLKRKRLTWDKKLNSEGHIL